MRIQYQPTEVFWCTKCAMCSFSFTHYTFLAILLLFDIAVGNKRRWGERDKKQSSLAGNRCGCGVLLWSLHVWWYMMHMLHWTVTGECVGGVQAREVSWGRLGVPEYWWPGRWGLWRQCTRSRSRTHPWAGGTWKQFLLRESSGDCPPCRPH